MNKRASGTAVRERGIDKKREREKEIQAENQSNNSRFQSYAMLEEGKRHEKAVLEGRWIGE